jgi:hypothetical protein
MGDLTGDIATTVRGCTLTEWIDDHQLLLWNKDMTHGVPTYTTFRRGMTFQSITDLITSNFTPSNPSMSIRTDLSLGSDHHLISTSFDLPPPDTIDAAQPTRRMWNLSQLQEVEPSELYESIFADSRASARAVYVNSLIAPPTSRSNIEQLADELNELIYDALTRYVGDRSPRPKHRKWF